MSKPAVCLMFGVNHVTTCTVTVVLGRHRWLHSEKHIDYRHPSRIEENAPFRRCTARIVIVICLSVYNIYVHPCHRVRLLRQMQERAPCGEPAPRPVTRTPSCYCTSLVHYYIVTGLRAYTENENICLIRHIIMLNYS